MVTNRLTILQPPPPPPPPAPPQLHLPPPHGFVTDGLGGATKQDPAHETKGLFTTRPAKFFSFVNLIFHCRNPCQVGGDMGRLKHKPAIDFSLCRNGL